jgi:hypothetical protein
MEHRVISADCHLLEPPWVFDRVPAEYRERAPKVRRGADGGDGWSLDGGPPKRTFGVEAMAGRAKRDYRKDGLRFEEIMPGNYDGAAHVKDMDQDGVDVSVVYPANSIFIYAVEDRGLALACMRAFNDWVLEEFQGANPRRLVGLPMLPVDDGIEVAIAELDRGLAKGARAAFIPGIPRRPYHDPYSPEFRRASGRAGLGRGRRASLHGGGDGLSLLRRRAAPDVHALRRGLRAAPEAQDRGGGGELRLDPVLGPDAGPAVREPDRDGRAAAPARRPRRSASTSSRRSSMTTSASS